MEIAAKQTNNRDILKMSIIGVFVLLLISVLSMTVMHDWRFEHRLAHSLLEISGSIIAVLIVVLMHTSLSSVQLKRTEITWISAALVSMGLLDSFHATTEFSNNFIWFDSAATLAGGIFFASLWLSGIINLKRFNLPIIVTFIVTLGFVVWALLFPANVPTMLTPAGEFSLFTKLMKLGGGLGFIIGYVFLYKRYLYTGYRHYFLLSAFCLLFGIAGGFFNFSYLWSAQWWWWHILCFAAYLILIAFFFDSVRVKLIESVVNPQVMESSHTQSTHATNNQSGLVLLQLIGFSVIILGLMVLVGWYTNNLLLIQILPHFAPMQYNTALGFLLSGIGLFALTTDRFLTVATTCGGLVAALGALTLMQYLFGIDLGIDQIFMESYITVRTSHPGRMAPNTALCFMLMGLTLLCIIFSKHHKKLMVISELTGLLILALSMMALLGYIQNVEAAYGWGKLTRMAVHTGLGFVVLAMCIIYYHYLQQQKRNSKTVLPLWISFFFMTATLAFDLSSPLGIAAGFTYIPIVFCSLWFPFRGMPFIFAITLSCLVILGFFAVPDVGINHDIVLTNRILSIMTIWIVAAIVYLQKLTQKALLDNKTQLKLILDNAAEGIYGMNRLGQTTFANKKSADILGYTQEEMLNIPQRNFNHHSKRTLHKLENCNIYAALNDGKTHTEDNEVFWHKDGHTVPVEYTSAPERDQNGHITGAVVVFKDITIRKENEEKIKSDLYFRDLVMSNIPQPIFVKDVEFKIVQANSAFKNLYPKVMQDQIIGFTTLEEFRPEEAKRFLANDKLAFEKGYSETEETIHFPNGEKRVLFTRKIRFENEHAEKFILAVSLDITDSKKAEDEREKLIDKLTNSNEELERFAYVASHDLQEPLRMVTSFTKLLEKRYGEKLDDQAKEYINIASSSALRMQELVNDLLEYARIGEEMERYEKVPLEKTMHIVQENLKESIEHSRAQIIYHDLPTITTNPIRFMRLLQNLVGNALKYQAQNNQPEIRINADLKGDEWIISIADNGIGMKQKYCKKIFEPFQRLHVKKEFSGTGMGLAICRKIVEGFGGRIWADSEPGEGSVFYFTVLERGTSQITEKKVHGRNSM